MSSTYDPNQLLIETTWIRALARSLVKDPNLADDVVQDTWVTALERRPDGTRPIRSWIATVLHRHAGKRRARDVNRLSREREVARDEATVSTLDVLERTTTHRDLVESVLALDEPYRSTILLRFFDDLSYAEIARQMDTTSSTVNSRLTRGLARLRTRLEGRYGSGQAWLLVLQPLAQASKGLAAASGGIMTMNTTSQVSLIALASTAVAVGSWLPSDDPAPRPAQSIMIAGDDADDEHRWETTLTSHVGLDGVKALRLRTGAGSIEVREGDEDELHIESKIRADTRRVDSSSMTETFSDHVAIRTEGGVLIIEDAHSIEGADSDGWQVSLLIRTPRSFPVTAKTGAGSVSVTSAKESVDLSAGAGSVSLSAPDTALRSVTARAGSGSVSLDIGRVDGSLDGRSGAGTVKVRIRESGKAARVSLSTKSGSITLVAPPDVSGHFDLSTGTGSISLPDSLNLEHKRKRHVGATAHGRVGSRDTSYELHCSVGSIRIRLE